MQQKAKWDAGLYDDKHSFVWKMASDLLELLNPKVGEQILDVGCGTGHLTAKIAERGAQVTGVDQSAAMIRQARQAYPAIRFEVGDARELALEETFDAVFSNATLHWVKEAERAVEAIHRRLKPGGRFVAEFGGKGNIATLMNGFERCFQQLGLPWSNPWYYPGIGEYAGLLEKHGLEVREGMLFDRPTVLEDGEQGLKTWIRMFGESVLKELDAEQREKLVQCMESHCREALFKKGSWELDYRRLRISARKS